jgi:Na+/H+-dicarboxylate symporter
MPLTMRILTGLALGLIGGVVLFEFLPDSIGPVGTTAQVIGGLWLNALRMTIIPLVFALLALGVVNAAALAGQGTLALKTVVTYVVLLLVSAVLGAALTLGLLPLFPIPDDAAQALRSSAGLHHAEIMPSPPLSEMLLGIIPANPIEAAANGAMLQIVIFALVFGLALTRVNVTRRAAIVDFLHALNDVMFVIVRWVLIAAPLGVCALGLSLALRAGASAFGALAHYVAFSWGLAVIGIGLAYVMAWIGGGISPWRFARGVAPAQAVAVSTQSSLASLPATLTSTDALGIPRAVSGVTLPLAVSIFRFNGPMQNLMLGLYGASLYGMHPSFMLIVAAILVAVVIEQSSIGLPNQLNFFTALSAGLCRSGGAG